MSRQGLTLVVVPTQWFGKRAVEAGLIAAGEVWTSRRHIDRHRGQTYETWRYLDSLDRPPAVGSGPDVVQAWLERPAEKPFPPLSWEEQMVLNSMCMGPAVVSASGVISVQWNVP